MYGNWDTYNSTGNLGAIARAVGPSFAYLNLACGNDRGDQFLKNHAKRASLAQYASTIFIHYGANDLAGGQTAEQVLASRSGIAALFGAKRIIETTIYPRTTSSDNWETTVNQKVLKTEQARVEINNTIRAGRPGIDHFVDTAAAVETGMNSGVFLAPRYTPDGAHLYRIGQLRAATAINQGLVI